MSHQTRDCNLSTLDAQKVDYVVRVTHASPSSAMPLRPANASLELLKPKPDVG